MNAYQPKTITSLGLKSIMSESIKAPPCDRRPLIQCELAELEQSVTTLETMLERLGESLSPALLERDLTQEACPSPPDAILPPLGDSLRVVRRRVEAAARRISEINARLEL